MRARRVSIVLPALLTALLLAPVARADTTFGANPAEGTNTQLSCSFGAPVSFGILGLEPAPGTVGSDSCMWTWSNPAVGTDIVPFPASGGSGTITSVTLPAMTVPGPMAVVVLTAALNATTNPATPNFICCQVKQVGPTFTVPARQVTTVPQNLHVSATEEANLSQPGDTSFGDLVGVAVLSPSASLPIRYTGNTTSVTDFDGASAYYSAPTGPDSEFTTPYNTSGFRLLASFTVAFDAGGNGGGGGGGAADGLKLARKPVRVGADGKTVVLGKAANPPTARTTQTLTAPAPARAAAAGGKAKKPVVYGSGKTQVASGKTAKVKVKLNRKGRAKLKRQGKLKATLRVVAFDAAGGKQTVTRTVTVKPKKPKKRR